MQSKYIWLKYRHRFADGSYTKEPFKYELLVSETDAEDLVIEKREKYNWAEHYRGIEYEVFHGFPPKEVVIKLSKRAESMTTFYRLESETFKAILGSYPEEK